MTSRVEELQRMCDNINENGGLDSGKWHTALLAQIAQNLAVIADVMLADRKDEPQTENPCDGCVCDDGKHLMYCMNCKGIAWKTEPPKVEDEPQIERSE